MNPSAWNHLLEYKSHFVWTDSAGFGAYLIQYVDNNNFDKDDIVNVPDSDAFYSNNIIQNYFGDFGCWAQLKSAMTLDIFNIDDGNNIGYALNSLFTNSLANIKFTTAIKISFSFTYGRTGPFNIGPYSVTTFKDEIL